MPMYDVRCANGHEDERLAKMDETVTCRICGLPAPRILKSHPRNVISDEWAGGKTFENGFATPQTFYSPSEYRKALKQNGFRILGDGDTAVCPISKEALKAAEDLVRRVHG